jgi:AraC-like DNA-binding protein
MYIYIFFILVGSIVFLSTIVMTVWFKTNRVLNVYIIFTSILLCLYLILYGLNNLKPFVEISTPWHISYSQIILILTPSVYLFFEKIIFDVKYFETKDILYFIIPSLRYYYLGTELNQKNATIKIIIFILFVLYTFFYVYKSYCILNKHIWDVNSNQKKMNSIVKNWASFIFKMKLIVLFHFYISESFYLWVQSGGVVNSILEIGLLIVFLIGYFKVITTPELLYGSAYLKKKSDTNEINNLSVSKVWNLELNKQISNHKDAFLFKKINDKISDHINNIEKITVTNNSFKEAGYSIIDLSKELGLPKYYLDFIFKYYCKLTFNDYKRLVRIYVAVQLINDGYLNSNKLDTLAKHVGFASYNPFLINFKEIIGTSPFEYNKDRIIYKSNYLF